ncbi:hypothetical protein [Rhodococcus ruber]|uniref:hypothetical protein n=1 Tax=Rhodococcus ruber TaxID=1830 RepID=UPI001F2DBE7D|nr:hypothetical protein [Rhodococcus ruber]MCF8783393.1 hypothetical protein [Rhodococcus ruber]
MPQPIPARRPRVDDETTAAEHYAYISFRRASDDPSHVRVLPTMSGVKLRVQGFWLHLRRDAAIEVANRIADCLAPPLPDTATEDTAA